MVVARKSIQLPQRSVYFIAAPIVIILNSIITGTSQPDVFLFRELFLVGGLLFFFSLFQFKPRQVQVELILLIIALSTIIQSTIGILQIFYPELFGTWFATLGDDVPRGVFQQINVQASFLSTGIAISFYLLSRPIAKRFSTITSGFLILSVGLGAFVIIYSGSRVGLFSLVISLFLLLVFRARQLMQNKILVLCAIIAIASGSILSKSGMEQSLAKTANIARGESSDVRINMYRIAAELIAQQPLQGHGIGNFLRVWNLQASDYVSRHPHARLPAYVNHPHNELVYWLIEGGLVIVSGILVSIFAVLMGLIRCGPKRAAGYTAMLLPITFHTQIELPFYISSIHWFLWLFLIFTIMRHGACKKFLTLSNAANRLIQCTSIIIFVTSLYFLQHTSRAQADIMDFVTQRPIDTPYLQTALQNSYHKRLAQELAMRALLYKGITTENRSYVSQYIQWSAKPLAIEPKLILFEDLVNAFTFLKDDESKCKILKLGLEMYAHNESLGKLNQSCVN